MIYFDNAASSFPKPSSVSRAVGSWLRDNGANPGRSSHKPAIDAASKIFDTRNSISELFGLDKPENIAFVPNATYGLNFLIQGLLEKGDHVITTDLEHNSVLRPLYLMREKGVSFDIACVDLYDDKKTILNILKYINKNTKAVICTQCSNVCGKILPIEELSISLPENILLIVDGSQGAGIIPTDLRKLGIDYYCAPSHKGLLGPQGSGFIAVNSKSPTPIIVGGTGSDSFNHFQPSYMPDALESGTLPTPVIAGLHEGIKFINSIGVDKIFTHKTELVKYADKKLKMCDKVITYTDASLSVFTGCTCFNVKNKGSDEVSAYLSDNDICTRSGIHCAPLFHKKMGTQNIGMVRISFGYFNSFTQIDKFIKILNKI